MFLHLVRMGGITTAIVLCIIYPFLPGKYDGLATPLSTLVQLFSVAALPLVPIGVLWLIYERSKRAQNNRNLPGANRRYYFALASLIAASIALIAAALPVLFGVSASLGVFTLALWFIAVYGLTPRLRRLKTAESQTLSPIPFYLLFVPLATLAFQALFAGPATEFSRNLSIEKSAELIDVIEKHRADYGRYPNSLQAVWKDYSPWVVGVEQYHYAPNGEAYNLYFEQPRFLFDNIGVREFVMYNKRNEHVMPSHASWVLIWSPQQLASRQGWHAVADVSSPNWKRFMFD